MNPVWRICDLLKAAKYGNIYILLYLEAARVKNATPSILTVKPSSVIRSDYKSFSKLCHDTDDPILVTNNGENDLVVMSHEAFCRREALFSLRLKLASAEKQIAEGKVLGHDAVFARLRERVQDAL